MDLREVGWGGMEWIHVTRIGLVEGYFEHGNEPLGSIRCWELLE
jgi:hypothetical protein